MPKTAAVLVIGDEILSGRTQDTNTNAIARFLAALGIDLKEVRVVGDVEGEIVTGLNALRAAGRGGPPIEVRQEITVDVDNTRLLADPAVAHALDELLTSFPPVGPARERRRSG